MNSKKLIRAVSFLALVLFLSSCNRGGTGCPFELSAGLDLLQLLAR
ncbi:MAG: hypothetical protein HKN68_02255 [Saprospiraceae bacterium]|jgi:hypothetical protein|nr:hypothetical protein [Saprospiraceae bacterium]